MNWTIMGVLGTSLRILARNATVFLGLALLFSVPSLVMDLLHVTELSVSIVTTICGVPIAICLTTGTILAMAGHEVSLARLLAQLLGVQGVMLFGLTIVQAIAITAGLFLLIAPGLFLLAMWAVAAPAMVAEHASIGEALTRSAKLTENRRWAVLATFALAVLVAIVFAIALLMAIEAFAHLDENSAPSMVISWVIGAVFSSVVACVPAVLYAVLREEKDGATIEQIASPLD